MYENQKKQTPGAFTEALKNNIQGSDHAIKLIGQLAEAVIKTRSSNLIKLANAVETEADPKSVHRQIQRFLKNENEVEIEYLRLMKLTGKVKILIDRTEWKFGKKWINILTVSVAYRQVALPLIWEVAEHKGNATAAEHRAIIAKVVGKLGAERIAGVYADREFGSAELFSYLIEEGINFYIRLKSNHLCNGRSFKKKWEKATEKVRIRGRRKVRVFGQEVYVSGMKYRKNGKTEYLIVASKDDAENALHEYKVRWQIETMFGCLKSRGFNFEETHLTNPQKIGKMMMILGLGLCLALKMGEIQVEILKKVKMKVKKNERLAKSFFRIGLDALQNVLFSQKIEDKYKQLQLFIRLLSCT